MIADAIRKELKRKGMTESSGPPALLVNFEVRIEHKVQHVSSCTPSNENRYWEACEIKEMEYDEGTLSLRFTDRDKQQVVWEGWVSAVLANRDAGLDKAVEKGVREILAGFKTGTPK